MNKTLVGVLIGLLVGAGATWLMLQPRAQSDVAKAAAPEAAKSKEKENPLHVPPAKRAAAGIVLVKPLEANVVPEVSGFGRVVDPTPLVALMAELESARAASVASEKEAERVRKLFEAGANASAQAVESAEAAAARDRVAMTSARSRLLGTWGRDVAEHLEAVSKAVEQGGALARISALPGETIAPTPRTIQVSVVGSDEVFAAEVLGPAPVADLQVQGASFLVLLRERSLPAGAALRAVLPGAGEPSKLLTVPRSAIVYHQGSAWIFVLGEEDTFERKLVRLDRSVGEERVAIAQGLDAAEQVVSIGANQLLAAELQAGGAPEEE
jgi:hypothetical protein